MASVTRLMLEHPDERFSIRAISTFDDSATHIRLWVGVRGVAEAAWCTLRGRADVLHIHIAHGGSVVRKSIPLAAARLRNVPVIVHGHSFNFAGWMDRLPGFAKALVRTVLRPDLWLVLSSNLSVEYQACLGVPEDRIRVLHNPVRLNALPAIAKADNSVSIVSMGRLGKRKGSYDLIEALALLEPTVRERTQTVLAGDGEVAEVRDAASARGIADQVSVVGWIDTEQRDQLLRKGDIFVLPSYDEGLPMAVLEAMAAGLAIIATPVGGIPDAVADGVEGILVRPGDHLGLSRAIAILVEDEDLRARLAAAAADRARDFDITLWYQALSEIWIELVAASSKRG
jgi:glycosyltransferase involved in cell wall biosynthesis